MENVEKRIREFCELVLLVNNDTNEFYPKEVYESDKWRSLNFTKTFEEWNLKSVNEWSRLMNSEIRWIRAHKKEVLNVLPQVSKDWPCSCQVIRSICVNQ